MRLSVWHLVGLVVIALVVVLVILAAWPAVVMFVGGAAVVWLLYLIVKDVFKSPGGQT